MRTIREPVCPDTVTVNGGRIRLTDDRFDLLLFDRAILREQSPLQLLALGRDAPPDHHLEVPWLHEGEELLARVRPKGKWVRGRRVIDARFVRDPDSFHGWSIDYAVEARDHGRRSATAREAAPA